MNKFKFRDLLAVPFWVLGQKLEMISLIIGGEWTAKMFLEQFNKLRTSLL